MNKLATDQAEAIPGPCFPEGAIVAEYRAYVIALDGGFTKAVGFVAPDEKSAKQYAARFADREHGVELWQLDRKVASIPSTP